MSAEIYLEPGELGPLAVVRLKPNEDLVSGVEQAAQEAGFEFAIVRSGVGSLTDAAFGFGAGETAGVSTVEGPGLEILTLSGEIRSDGEGNTRAFLQGNVCDMEGDVHGGIFLRGANPICITIELVLQEWRPSD